MNSYTAPVKIDPDTLAFPPETLGAWFTANLRGPKIGEDVITMANQLSGFDADGEKRLVGDAGFIQEYARAEDFLNTFIRRPEGSRFGADERGNWGLWMEGDLMRWRGE